MASAKASRRVNGTEATHWPISALDPSMILLNAVVEILAVPVADIRTKLASDRTRVTVMPVGGHTGRSDASHRLGRSKKLLRRGHIAGLAQHRFGAWTARSRHLSARMGIRGFERRSACRNSSSD